MQCKDIPDAVFLGAVRAASSTPSGWSMRWDVQTALEVALGCVDVPDKLLLAKARRLESRGLLGGCTCGCRGDWHPSEECVSGCCRRTLIP